MGNSCNIIDLLQTMVAEHPERPALIHGEAVITYRELDERSRAVGTLLQAEGVVAGQRALLLVPLGIDFYVLFLGLARIGVTVILVDPAVGQAQIRACCEMVVPDLFVGSVKAHLLRLLNPALRRIPHKFALSRFIPGSRRLDLQAINAYCNDATTTAETPVLITFTSGSTGTPKGIVRTHGFLIKQHEVLCHTIAAKTADIEMNTLPVFMLSSLARGVTVVIPAGFTGRPTSVNAVEVVAEMRRRRVTRLLAAPAFCEALAQQLAVTDETVPTLTQIYTGGGPVYPTLVETLKQRCPGVTLTAVYGSTEAEPIAHVDLSMLATQDHMAMAHGKGLVAGQPIAEIRLAILPDRTGQPLSAYGGPNGEDAFCAEQLPVNRAGEIVVSGDHVQQGYLCGDDGLTKFRVGETIWHRTGDAGYLDNMGRLWLLGRCSARIGHGEAACYPFGMEAAAMSHSGVARAAFVEVQGEGLLAVQTTREQWPALIQSLRQALPTVARFERVDKIPVDTRHGSKVLYRELQSLLVDC